MHVRRCGPVHLRLWRRYVLQTLRNSRSLVDTIDQADVVYVYDYCYHMRALADHHAQRQWWLKDRYNPERATGKHLLMAYRSGHMLAVHHLEPLAVLHCSGHCLCAQAPAFSLLSADVMLANVHLSDQPSRGCELLAIVLSVLEAKPSAWRRAMMALPCWRRSGGANFVFFHAHPGFEWDDLDVTTDMQSLFCNDFQWATMVVVEQGQRWRCPTFTPRSTILAPYASTEVVSSLDLSVPDEERDVLAFFRCAAADTLPLLWSSGRYLECD